MNHTKTSMVALRPPKLDVQGSSARAASQAGHHSRTRSRAEASRSRTLWQVSSASPTKVHKLSAERFIDAKASQARGHICPSGLARVLAFFSATSVAESNRA